ncbi:MAG: DUF2523 family protein [Candidatus Methylumidiphilus sp.]
MDKIITVLDELNKFIHSGIYDFATALYAKYVIWYTIASLEAKIHLVAFFWGVASQVLQQLDISSHIQNAWASLDSNTVKFLTFFRVPEIISIILHARLTRYIMSMMGY